MLIFFLNVGKKLFPGLCTAYPIFFYSKNTAEFFNIISIAHTYYWKRQPYLIMLYINKN